MNLSQKTRRRLRNYRGTIYLSIVLMLICIILKFLDVEPWIEDFADSIIGAIIGILLVNLMYQWRAEKDLEEDMAQNLIDVLAGEYDDQERPRLYKLFNKPAIERILTRCIESYCTNPYLAGCYINYIKNSYPLIKQDEDYAVTVRRDGQGRSVITQTLKDTRIFPTASPDDLYIYVYLVLAKGTGVSDDSSALDKVLSDNRYFIREELLDPSFVDSLTAVMDGPEPDEEKRRRLIGMLGFSVRTFCGDYRDAPRPFDPESAEAFLRRDTAGRYRGIEIKVPVPKECVSVNRDFYPQEGFVEYTAEVTFSYPVPAGRVTFYSVYATPTIRSDFKLRFAIRDFDCRRSVDCMRFISFAEEDIKRGTEHQRSDGNVVVEEKLISFHTQRTIFPRSGISFSWDDSDTEKD